MKKNFYNHEILPRYCFAPYLASKLILIVASKIFSTPFLRAKRSAAVNLGIEAGEMGWKSIEFKELYQSACEYLGSKNIHQLIIQKDKSYFNQVSQMLKQIHITHYVYDPRTSNSDDAIWTSLWQSFKVALLLTRYNIVPIVLLTDLSVRVWRTQAAIVSADKGLVVTFISPKSIGTIFPHNRLLGPSLMPFSLATLGILNAFISQKNPLALPRAIFQGSLYEPRNTMLKKIKQDLSAKGQVFEIKARVIGGPRVPDHEYWLGLCSADIVLTTADQMIQGGTDWTHIRHLVYRYLEILASGALCIGQMVDGIERYFTPGVHFVVFESANDAVELVSYYLKNSCEAKAIAKRGKERADALISSRIFWVSVDSALGSSAMI